MDAFMEFVVMLNQVIVLVFTPFFQLGIYRACFSFLSFTP